MISDRSTDEDMGLERSQITGIMPEADEGMDESSLLEAIEKRVSELILEDPDLLFSYLYRLDIPQEAIELALYHSDPLKPSEALAHVILERQRARLKTKRSFPQKPIEGWDSF